MLSSSIIAPFLVAAPLLVIGTVLPNSLQARDCLVDSAYRDTWIEDGFQRYRTVFSAGGDNADANLRSYCVIWQQYRAGAQNPFTNIQCGYDANVDGGSWRVDVNTARGAGGEGIYYTALGATRSEWIQKSGCRTG